METPIIVELLNTREFKRLVRETYFFSKEYLDKRIEVVDDRIMISYARAYITNEYEKLENDLEKRLFLEAMRNGYFVVELMDCFIKSINSTRSKMGDLVHKDTIEELNKLLPYKNTDMYKELSKYNNYIAKTIKEFHGYRTIKELRERCKDKPQGRGLFREYIISEEELNVIEGTKNYFLGFNQYGHMLFDEKKNADYYWNHEVKNKDEIFKNLIVNTKKNNPRFDIVFNDGMILEYFKGDIRLKPYKFGSLVHYTKLYLVKNHEEMEDAYADSIEVYTSSKDNDSREQFVRQLLLNSFVNVFAMLHETEDIYTKKMIDDAKTDMKKMKELVKKYQL